MRTKFKTGQVWKDIQGGATYQITRIGMHSSGGLGAWALCAGNGEEVFFAYLEEDQTADLHSSWVLQEKPQETKKAISKECPCGIFRGDCDYHK